MEYFDKSRRLQNKADFDYVFNKAHRKKVPGFVVLYRPNHETYARLGFVIPKKILAKAYQRNRIKRLLRESFRKQDLPALDIIFLAKAGLAEEKNADITRRLDQLWDELCGKL